MGRILPIELKEFPATGMTLLPVNFGTPLANPAIKVNFFNEGDEDAYVTGLNTPVPFKVRIPAYGCLTLDESTLYFRGTDQEYYLPRNAQLQVGFVNAASSIGLSAIIAHVITRVLQ